MDIRQLAVQETAVLHLRDGADNLLYEGGDLAKPVTITLYSPGSKVYAKASAERNNRIVARLKQRGKADRSADESAQEAAEFLAACTHSFAHIELDDLQGEALYLAVYTDASIGFIAEQAGKYLGEWGNFTKGLATS